MLTVSILALGLAAGPEQPKLPKSKPETTSMVSGVALVGYQVRLTPQPPWKLGRLPSGAKGPKAAPETVIVARTLDQGVKNLLIAPGKKTAAREFQKKIDGEFRALRLGEDGTSVMLGAGMEDVAEVGSVTPSAAPAGWRIETSSYTVQWPEGYTVGSVRDGAPFPFEFERVGAPNELIVLRGPLVGAKQVPSPDALVGKDQEPVAMDMKSPTPWVEVRYQVDGKPWRQRHYYAVLKPETIVLVTIQAPEERAAQIAQIGDQVASSVKPLGEP